MTPVELDGEQDVGGLRTAVGDKRLVRRTLEVGIVQLHVGVAVARRRQVDQTAARLDERRDPVHEDEMAQMIGAELRFKTVQGLAKRRGHHAGVGDDDIERLASRQKLVRGMAEAFETGQIELDELEAASARSGVLAYV